MDKSEQAVMGARAALVGPKEIRRLILAALRAHKTQLACGLADEDFDVFRKGALWDAVKLNSFRDVTHHKLGKALAYFDELAGRATRADARITHREKCGESDRTKALHVLKLECQRSADVFGSFAGAEAYATALLRKTHKLPEGSEWRLAHARQLWQTMFTLRNRAAAKRKKIRAASDTAVEIRAASDPAELEEGKRVDAL